MVRVSFTSHLTRHVACPLQTVEAATVRQAFELVFERLPDVRQYVVDDQGALRKHVAVFVDGQQLADRVRLSDALGPNAEIHVMQALSGG